MCCLFGLCDFNNILSAKRKEKMIRILSHEAEIRGSDSTGIAYISGNSIIVDKKPKPAHLVKFKLKCNPHVITGHTRLSTKGDYHCNFNNHPFYSKKLRFALSHNGVIYNDEELKISENLPSTKIQTDSYVILQLLEKEKSLGFESIKSTIEKIHGSYSLSILADSNTLYLVKGNNPLEIADCGNYFVYASTLEILEKSLLKLKIRKYSLLRLDVNTITKIDGNDLHTDSYFSSNHDYISYFDQLDSIGYHCDYNYSTFNENTYESLIDYAMSINVGEDDINYLLENDYSIDEIYDILPLYKESGMFNIKDYLECQMYL